MHDVVADMRALPARSRLGLAARRAPRGRRVLALGVARAPQAAIAARAARELERSSHAVDVRFTAPAPGAGKWANLNAALAEHPAAGYDWLMLVDDDVVLPRGFLDGFLALAERHGLALAQPAHAFRSHAAWRVTRRRPGVMAASPASSRSVPSPRSAQRHSGRCCRSPTSRWAGGSTPIGPRWPRRGAGPVGVIDATPIRHLRPVAESYPRDAALAEAAAFLRDRPYVGRARANDTLAGVAVTRGRRVRASAYA